MEALALKAWVPIQAAIAQKDLKVIAVKQIDHSVSQTLVKMEVPALRILAQTQAVTAQKTLLEQDVNL
jgi:hypothetical protein